MALTTTTGRSASRPCTIWPTRSIAFASCTEVPPNFMTIMGGGAPCGCGGWQTIFSPEIPLRLQEFGIEESGSGGSAYRIVGEHGEFPVQHIALAQAPNRGRHSRTRIHIQPRLRAVNTLQTHHRLSGPAG